MFLKTIRKQLEQNLGNNMNITRITPVTETL